MLWKPIIQETAEFDVRIRLKIIFLHISNLNVQLQQPKNINGRKYNGHQKYGYNLPQLLEDFRIIGQGLVENVVQCE